MLFVTTHLCNCLIFISNFQECGGLYDIVVDIMYKLHARKLSCHDFYVTGLSQIDLVSYILAS